VPGLAANRRPDRSREAVRIGPTSDILRRMTDASQFMARRIGRIAFGAVLLAGVAYLVAAAFTVSFAIARESSDPPRIDAARVIVVTWLVAATAGSLASRIAARFPRARHPDWLFAESLIAPTLGIALLLPITLHMPVALVFGDSSLFDGWVLCSLWITGLTHIVFAAMCARRAHNLVAGRPARSPRRIYVATLITSCVPFILLVALPPVIVAITLLPFLPLLRAMETLVARERREMAEARYPRAIVRLPSKA
jgi:hypothetical protein